MNNQPTLPNLTQPEDEPDETGWVVTDRWEWNGYTAECHDQIPRPDRNHYRRHRARGEPACPISSINHGLFQRMKAVGHLEAYTPKNQTYLCELHSPFQPNFGHLLRHQARNEDACPQSQRENRAASYLKKHGSLEGWVDKIGGETILAKYNCDIHDPVNPGLGHACAHYSLGEAACDQALREGSAQRYVDKHGTLEGWPGWRPQSDGSQHNCELHTPFIPNTAHRSYHRNRKEKECVQGNRERSAYDHIERYGNLDGWIDKALGETYWPYNCDIHNPFEPTPSHASAHYHRKEKSCEQSLRELSAYKYREKYGTLEGWVRIKQNVEGHICIPHDPVRPNKAHYAYHRGQGEPGCFQSKKEQSAYEYKRTHNGSLVGWDYSPVSGYESDCGTTGPIVPTMVHYKKDKDRFGEACDRAKLEASLYRHKHRHGTTEGWTPNLFRRGQRMKHRVYKIVFLLNYDWYYGITCMPIEERIDGHIAGDKEAGMRIAEGELYLVEILCELPNKKEAEAVERVMIRSGNPYGRLLNIRENPWYGLPAPHWGSIVDRETFVTETGQPRRIIKTRYGNEYLCGGREMAQRPNSAHLSYHRSKGEDGCPASLEEASWNNREKTEGEAIPDYTTLRTFGKNIPWRIDKEKAEPDRADCCGAPLYTTEAVQRYRSRHIYGAHDIPRQPCEAALRCVRAYDRERRPSQKKARIEAEKADTDRMDCCGAPKIGIDLTPKYADRHRRGNHTGGAPLCAPAIRCQKAYNKNRNRVG